MRIISQGGALAAASLVVSACGFGGSKPAAAAHVRPKAHAAVRQSPAEHALEGMVDAVGPSRSQPPVSLKFAIRARPQVGQDVEIDYALIPRVPGLQALRVAFVALGGLTVVSGSPAPTAAKPAVGVPIFGSVTVRPAKPGLYTLTATVAVESPSQSVAWPFRIPVIAGQGPAQTAANQP